MDDFSYRIHSLIVACIKISAPGLQIFFEPFIPPTLSYLKLVFRECVK